MFKRIALFIATNLAVILVLSIVLRLLGVDSILDEQQVGIDYQSLLILSAVIGFGGSFISLAISKWMAKRSTGAKVIEQPANEAESWLISTVQRQAQQAGIDMPEVADLWPRIAARHEVILREKAVEDTYEIRDRPKKQSPR